LIDSFKIGKLLDEAINSVLSEIGKFQVGIEGLDSLRRDKCELQNYLFRCEATASKASIMLEPEHKLEIAIKMSIWGKIRGGRIVRLRMEDAVVEMHNMPDRINMWRPRALRQIERELRRRYLRLALATKRVGRKMLPMQIAN